MALRDVAGIFSRAFVVGHFIPAFAALVIVQITVHEDALPNAYNDLGEGTQLLVVGGIALMVGLVLWGLHHPVLRLFQGYSLKAANSKRYPRIRLWPTKSWVGGWKVQPLALLYDTALTRKKKRFERLQASAESGIQSPQRTLAVKTLMREWPTTATQVLPSRFGNVCSSYEGHARQRYNLNGIYAYPRIATMLNEAEREIITEARTDVAFFLNLALLAVLGGGYVIVDSVWHGWWDSAAGIAAVLLPPLIYAAATRAAYGAADRWGSAVRTSFDLHRLELYERVGLRRPATQSEEESIANALNRLLVYADPLPDALRDTTDLTSHQEESDNGA